MRCARQGALRVTNDIDRASAAGNESTTPYGREIIRLIVSPLTGLEMLALEDAVVDAGAWFAHAQATTNISDPEKALTAKW